MLRRLFPKTLTLTAISTTSSSAISFLRPLSQLAPLAPHARTLSTLADSAGPNPNISALKLRHGCDYYRRLVIMQAPYHRGEREPTKDEVMDSYVRKLAELVGNLDEAKMMVYSCTISKEFYAFGTLMSQQLYDRFQRRVQVFPEIEMIFPDHDPSIKVPFTKEMQIALDQYDKLYNWEQQLGRNGGA